MSIQRAAEQGSSPELPAWSFQQPLWRVGSALAARPGLLMRIRRPVAVAVLVIVQTRAAELWSLRQAQNPSHLFGQPTPSL